jgi:predicted DNA binding CopG/RHH family protein
MTLGHTEGVNMSETRQMTALVAVRFAEDDLNELRQEAARRGISVQQLLRDTTLTSLRTAS